MTLSPSAPDIQQCCDGRRSVIAIREDLSADFGGADVAEDVYQFLRLNLSHGSGSG